MGQEIVTTSRSSWLTLVAETAGVSGATITRVGITCPDAFTKSATVYVQVLDQRGRLVGATRQVTRSFELREGLSLDLGYDLELALGATIIAWVEPGVAPLSAFEAAPGDTAQRCHFEPFSDMKFCLSVQPADPLAA